MKKRALLLVLLFSLTCWLPANAATIFLEPGGDADFGTTLWSSAAGTVVSDFVHGGHQRSLRSAPGGTTTFARNNIMASGGRESFYIYIVAYPTTSTSTIMVLQENGPVSTVRFRMTTAGVLQLWAVASQMGSDGPTLSLSTWYRVSLAHTITNSTTNRFEAFVDGVSAISVTNFSMTGTPILNNFIIGNFSTNAAFDARWSDIYVDNSSALTDPGDVWVTAKRPNANGTTNDFVTQVGAGGSGYGSGHSPQVNERAASDTNGWSVVAVGSAVTEEYSIENAATGDLNLTGATIIDYTGWVRAKALASETGLIKVGSTTSNISLTSTITTFQKVKGSSTYPAGSTDIGIVTDTTVTTVSLYECGIVVAYIPAVASNTGLTRSLLGVGK